jgi:hypothetical protein
MKIRLSILIILTILLSIQFSTAQFRRIKPLRKTYAAPEEIVSLSGTMTFGQAISIFSNLSKKYFNKVIIDPEGRNMPIGQDIDKMHWIDAMEFILKLHNLWYEEYEDYIMIIAVGAEQGEQLTAAELKLLKEFDSREVIISAVFFETDISKLREAGMSWHIFKNSEINGNASMTAAENKTGIFEITVEPDLDFADITAAFKALETENVGEVISSPQVTVKSGGQGRIQVGTDIQITVQDFAGNAVSQFVSTGSIIRVRPTIVRRDSVDFIILDLQVERSAATQSDVRLEIKKSTAETDLLLLDGEETIIGGLFINEESSTRDGIPFLKDLPWWFFGLRYVFGYESKNMIKKELLILLKAELLPTLAERFERKLDARLKKDYLIEFNRRMRQRMEHYERQLKGQQ